MASGIPLTKRQKDEVARLIKAGYTRPEVTRTVDFKISMRSIDNIIKDRNLTISRGHSNPALTLRLDPSEPMVRSALIKKLRGTAFISLSKLLVMFKCPERELIEAIDHIEQAGYNVQKNGSAWRIAKSAKPGALARLPKSLLTGKKYTFGCISDTHLASHCERLDVLEDAYDEFKSRGIKQVYHSGNLCDGQCSFNQFELFAHGATDQALYVVDKMPQRSGIKTYFISGDCHEGWWLKREGLNWGRYLMLEAKDAGRDDLIYLGHIEADIELPGGAIMRLMHPGGGTAYALSYATQKIIESLQGGEKPGLILCGHYHKFIYHLVRNVFCLQSGCIQDQTVFMRKNKLEAHVGYSIVTITMDNNGAIRRCTPEITQYFDRGYSVKMKVVKKRGKGDYDIIIA